MNTAQIASVLMEALDIRPAEDTVIPSSGLEVHMDGAWIPTVTEVWRAWTGRRRIWGMEHHGPVSPLGAPTPDVLWHGPRECRCSTCQSNVAPELRPN